MLPIGSGLLHPNFQCLSVSLQVTSVWHLVSHFLSRPDEGCTSVLMSYQPFLRKSRPLA
jgi:hypothetical protein